MKNKRTAAGRARGLVVAAVCGAGLAVGLAASPAYAQVAGSAASSAETPGAQAARFYQEGNKAFELKRWAEAEGAYQKAWALSPTFDVAANLGEVKFRLQQWREAAALLSFALRSSPPSVKEQQRKRMQHFLDEARKHVATLRPAISVEGAEVLVDGVKVTAEELGGGELFVAPGEHEVVARKAGYREAKAAVAIGPGAVREVALSLAELPKEAAGGGAGAAGPTGGGGAAHVEGEAGGGARPVEGGAPHVEGGEAPGRRSLVPAIALGAGSLVGIAVGIGLTAASNGASSDADALTAAIRGAGGQCVAPGAFASQCDELMSTLERIDTLGNGARVAFAAGGALAIGAAVYLLWPQGSDGAGAQTVMLLPVVGVREAGLGVQGAW